MKSAPDLQKAFATYSAEGVVFLAAFYMSKTEEIKKFKEQHHLTFPVGKARGVARELWTETIPETIFLSRSGEIAKRIRGKMSNQELIEGIEKILYNYDSVGL